MSEKDRITEPDFDRIRQRASEVERAEGRRVERSAVRRNDTSEERRSETESSEQRRAGRSGDRIEEHRADRDRESPEARRTFAERNPTRTSWRPLGSSPESQGLREAGHYQFGTGYMGYPGSAMYPFYLAPPTMPGYAGGYPDIARDDPERRHREEHHLFGTWGDAGRQARRRGSSWTPRTEMFDREGSLIVRVELPGMHRDDVDVCLERDRLVIEGERREEEERRQGEGFYQSEWSYGFFHREIPLPEPVDQDHVKAKFKDGILEVAIPQTDRASARKSIRIES
jgi:HSP20 family protein